jgi:cytochrome c oxidase subunit II
MQGRRFRTRRGWRNLLIGALALAGGVLLSGCNAPAFMAFRPADQQGKSTFNLWSGMVIAALVVGLFVLGLILWAVVAYRRPRHDDGSLPHQTHENRKWEVAYTTVPIVVVAVIFYFTVVVENKVDAIDPHPDLKIHVIAYRWGWIFEYSGTKVDIHTTTAGYPTMVLPENRTTEIHLTSNDVVHEFMVPQFLFGRYAQPGFVRQYFDFTPTQTGTFDGHCAVYCGLYHSEMLFYVRVVPPATFNNWLHGQEALAA